MRVIAVLIVLAGGGPAAAQPYLGLVLARDAQAGSDALAARIRSVALTNELAVLEARLQSDQALAGLQLASINPPAIVILPSNLNRPTPTGSCFASIPDEALARSNAAVRAAGANYR